jgi:sialidase-1
MQLVQDEEADPTGRIWIGNPVPVVDNIDPHHPGRVWLAFTRSNERVFVAHSDDHGATWSKRREITSTASKPEWGWYATGPVHGIQLERGPHKGRLILPCDHRILEPEHLGAHIVYSDDHGETWKLGATDTHLATDPLHPNENVAVELVDGRIYVNARDHQGSHPATRAIATSSDGGESYDAPFRAESNITSPVVQNSLVRVAARDRGDDENILVYCGPGHPRERRDLTILTSRDEGKTWTREAVIHTGPAAYSDVVALGNGRFGVLYEAGERLYDEIIFATLALDDLGSDQ